LDFLATGKYLDSLKFSPPPKIRLKMLLL